MQGGASKRRETATDPRPSSYQEEVTAWVVNLYPVLFTRFSSTTAGLWLT